MVSIVFRAELTAVAEPAACHSPKREPRGLAGLMAPVRFADTVLHEPGRYRAFAPVNRLIDPGDAPDHWCKMTRTELIIQLLKVAIGLAFGAYFVWWSLEVLDRLTPESEAPAALVGHIFKAKAAPVGAWWSLTQ